MKIGKYLQVSIQQFLISHTVHFLYQTLGYPTFLDAQWGSTGSQIDYNYS